MCQKEKQIHLCCLVEQNANWLKHKQTVCASKNQALLLSFAFYFFVSLSRLSLAIFCQSVPVVMSMHIMKTD